MATTFSRAKALKAITTLDMVGMTMCLQMNGAETPPHINIAMIEILSCLRISLAKAYGIEITAMQSCGREPILTPVLTSEEAAEGMIEECDDDAEWEAEHGNG
jgi:hypothetical protein